MRLDDKHSGDDLKIDSSAHGMDVPSACTIVIIAGIVKIHKELCDNRQKSSYKDNFSV